MAVIQMNPNKRLLSLANTWTLDQYINLNSANPGLKVNQSGSGLLMELQASGADKFNVDNAGLATSLVYGIATTPTDAFWADNRQAATVGVPAQYSPSFHWGGTAWNTVSEASHRVDMIAYLETVSANPVSGKLVLASSINGGAYSGKITIDTDGNLAPVSDTVGALGSSSKRFGALFLSADIDTSYGRLISTKMQGGAIGSRPAADSSRRSIFYNIEGGAGVADILQMCLKGAADTYSWVNIVTG